MTYIFPLEWSRELQSWYLWEIHIYGLAVVWFIVGLVAFTVALNVRTEVCPAVIFCNRLLTKAKWKVTKSNWILV